MNKTTFSLIFACSLFFAKTKAQVNLNQGWKFKQGDELNEWKTTNFNDTEWATIDVRKNWDSTAGDDYVGYGWYRNHFFISSALKNKSYLKDSVRLDLGTLDDGDEVYLNGILVGKNDGKGGDIKEGNYGTRIYTISSNNPAIKWDKENVLAVRIYNNSGPGGMSGKNLSMYMSNIFESIALTADCSFTKGSGGSLTSGVELISSRLPQSFTGVLNIQLIDPESGKVVLTKVLNPKFSKSESYKYQLSLPKLENKSFDLKYKFTEAKSQQSIEKTLKTPYILTPAIALKPKINMADIYGVRPQNQFLLKIPATGQAPLTYKVTGLPVGLSLDGKTGIIRGTIGKKGDYPVILSVSNKLGAAQKELIIKVGDKIGLTPALGWNSWNAWGLSVSDEKVKISAKEMADKLAAHGWAYINIDDGWEAPKRAEDGEIVTNNKFPDMNKLSDYVHSLGLKIGIYSSPGDQTCGGYLGSYHHELQDAQTYAKWNIDYLKYDWCSYGNVAGKNPSLQEMQKPYSVMRNALNQVNRDIIYSFCQYGMGDVYKWGGEIGGNSWRTTGDIVDTWASMTRIGLSQAKNYQYSKAGEFIDPDMLIVGKVGWGPRLHQTRLTPDEQYFHISLWSLLSSPLLIGCDMGSLDDFTLSLLTNDEVIAIDQDIKGIQAKQALVKDNYQVWVKELNSGAKAAGIFNTSDQYQTITLNWKDVNVTGYHKVRDVWKQSDLEGFKPEITVKIPPHGVKLLKVY